MLKASLGLLFDDIFSKKYTCIHVRASDAAMPEHFCFDAFNVCVIFTLKTSCAHRIHELEYMALDAPVFTEIDICHDIVYIFVHSSARKCKFIYGDETDLTAAR